MTNDEKVNAVMELCRRVIPYFERTFFNRYIQDYKNYLGYTGDRKCSIDSWQTNVTFPITSAIVDTMFASMYDSMIKFNIQGDALEGTDKILNAAFDYKHKGKEALMEAIKECIITGKGFMKPFFSKYIDQRIINGQDYGHTVKRPMLNYVGLFNIFYDYNCKLEDSPFTIERYIWTQSQIKKAYASKIKSDNPTAYIKNICDSNKSEKAKDRYSQYDVNRVKHIIAYEELITKQGLSTIIPGGIVTEQRNHNGTIDDTIDNRNNLYAIDFEKNKMYEVIEYSDEDGTVVLIDGVMLYVEKRSTDTSATKVVDISFNKIPGTSDATGIATNLNGLQTIVNGLYNIYLDNLKIQISPMFEQVGGLNQMLGKKNKIVYEPYKVIPTNTPGSLRKIELGVGGFEPINTIQFIEQFAEKRSGVNEYIMGGQGKVERIAGGVDLIFNQFKSKLMPLTNSINNAMGTIAKEFLLIYALNYSPEELKNLGLEDELDYKRFLNEENVTFHLSSLSLLSKEEGIKNLVLSLKDLSPFLQAPDGMKINTDELIKGILKRDVDVDNILKKPEKASAPKTPETLEQDIDNLNFNTPNYGKR